MATQIEASKKNWESNNTNQDINSGSLQRIANATELMASNYIKLQNERDMYSRLYYEKVAAINKRDRSIAALRGVITKLKGKISSTTK